MIIKKGEIWRLKDKSLVEILGVADNPSFIYVANLEDSHRYQQTIKRSRFAELVSSPLPLEIAIVNPLAKGNVVDHIIEICEQSLEKDKQIAQNKAKRGGKREGSGRKITGRKERKVLQVNLDIAKKLPELNQLAALLDEFRNLAYSTALRSQNLEKFYKALDAIERIA